MASKHQTKLIKEYEAKGYFVINLIRTNKNGIPDLLCLKENEKPLFIECKEKTDTVKPLQKYRIKELKNLGFDAIISKDKNPSCDLYGELGCAISGEDNENCEWCKYYNE